MSELHDMVVVTDWDKVSPDDFYLTKEWLDNWSIPKAERAKLRRMAKTGELFEAFEVYAVHYAIYRQMDAHKIFIDSDGSMLLSCESEVIGNEYREVWEGDSL